MAPAMAAAMARPLLMTDPSPVQVKSSVNQ